MLINTPICFGFKFDLVRGTQKFFELAGYASTYVVGSVVKQPGVKF